MSDAEPVLRPLLARYPDARRSPAALLEPILFPYLALMFGFGGALAGAYNAVMLRRRKLLLQTILVGLTGVVLFSATIAVVRTAGHSVQIAVILGRGVHFALGGVLYFLHRPHFKGHEFKLGSTLPMLQSYLAAILLSMLLPWRIVAVLLGGMFV